MSAATCPTSAAAEPPAARGSRRRRLWELPPSAHDLLLALSFDPDGLRREVARAIGHLHKARCQVRGAEADVLYSTVRDLVQRNAVSEAFQRRLDLMHAPVVRRWASFREPERLQQAWCAALQSDFVAPSLWALLTHPGATDLEQAALCDARAWVFGHARRHLARQAAVLAHGTRAAALEADLAHLRGRLDAQRREHHAKLDAVRQEMARLQGEAQRWRGACERLQAAAAETPKAPKDPARAPPDTLAAPRAACDVPSMATPLKRAAVPEPLSAAPRAAAPPAAVAGKQVLCVGGMQHAVARYRTHVERLGGRFEHHDGGLEEGLQRLDGRLARADLVICQAGCVNHEAYRRIKRHCAQAGKPCLYLDRPSLARFERALGPARHDEDLHA